MTTRTAKWLADTGWLLSFGAIPQGTALLRELFDGSLASPPTVKSELRNIATRPEKRRGEKNAASRYQGRNTGVLLDIAVEHADVVEREFAQKHLTAKTIPLPSDLPQPFIGPFPSGFPTISTDGHGGEAEAMAVCLRTELPLLMNDPSATLYAKSRKIPTENAAVSLQRVRSKTPLQLYKLYLEMEKVTTSGARVLGQSWFRQPERSSVSE